MAPRAHEYTDDCDLYLWKLFQCVVIRNLSQEQNEEKESKKRRKEEREERKFNRLFNKNSPHPTEVMVIWTIYDLSVVGTLSGMGLATNIKIQNFLFINYWVP